MKLLNRLLDGFEGKFTSSTSYELNDVRSIMGQAADWAAVSQPGNTNTAG